ncbi:Cdc25 phosphatase Ibp1 [Exophiala dermatitidis]|nr:Cdc25 phosphatase Ibp1 [Exophiala dermatitidis]
MALHMLGRPGTGSLPRNIGVLSQRNHALRPRSSSTRGIRRMATDSAPITLSSLTFVHPSQVAPLLLEPSERSKVAVIDVRDSDHIGGNITSSTWVPLHQLDARMPELVRTLRDKEKVIFHCMLSQQRGPKAALMYARAKQRAEAKEAEEEQRAAADQSENGAGSEDASAVTPKNKSVTQQICVLEGGFGSWQALYGEDPRLTVDYQPDLWV